MPPATKEDTMRIFFRYRLTGWRTRLYRKCNTTSLLLAFVIAYVCLFLFDANRVLKTVVNSDGKIVARKVQGDPLGLRTLTHKMKSIADTKKLNHVDLSVMGNDVRFRENRRKLICFEWDNVKDEIQNQVRSEQEQAPDGDNKPSDKPSHDVADNQLFPKLLRILRNGEVNLQHPPEALVNELSPISDITTAEEPGLLKPVSPSAATLRALYRHAISHAVKEVKDTIEDEAITPCVFPGFSQKESQQIWNQASRIVRIQHTCARYTSFLYPTNAAQDVIWNQSDNLGYCHQMEAAPNTWMKLLLEWGGEAVDPETAVDDARAEARLSQLYPPLPEWRMTELKSQNPLLFTVTGHPFIRIVSAYVNHIKRHYRYEDSLDWIREIRGLTFQEMMNNIRKNILTTSPALGRRGALNQLLAPVEGFGKHNKIRRNSNSTDTRLNFREFVWLVIKQNLECFNDIDCLNEVDPHWRPQYIWCSPCSLHFDFIVKDESFKEDSNLLLKLLGKPILPDVVTAYSSSTVPVTEQSQNDGLRNSSSAVPVTKLSQNDSLRNNSSVKTNRNRVRNRTITPIVKERKSESSLSVTGNISNNTAVKEKNKVLVEVDPYNIIEEELNDDLPREDLGFQYISYLTDEELSMLFVTYTFDFNLYGYNAAEF